MNLNNKNAKKIWNIKQKIKSKEIPLYKEKFLKLIEKEKNIEEEKVFFDKIEKYEENLKYFLEEIENKKLELVIKENPPKIRIKWDYEENFSTEKFEEENEKLKNIFEEYKIIAEKLNIKNFNGLSFLNDITELIENENLNFLLKFKDKKEIYHNVMISKTNVLEKYDFLTKKLWIKIDLENLYISKYIENYDFLKDKIDINKKIFEEIKKNNFNSFYLKNIYELKNEDLINKIKNILIEKKDYEKIYENIWYFLPLEENLFLEIKNYLLNEKTKIYFYENNIFSNFINFYEEKKFLMKKIIKSLNNEEFLNIFNKMNLDGKNYYLKEYFEEKNKNEIKNILQNFYENNILENYYLEELLKEYKIKLDYKEEISWFENPIYEEFFNNFPLSKNIKKIFLDGNVYFENWVLSEFEDKILDKIIETFSNNSHYLIYFLEDLNLKNYEKINNVLENKNILILLEKIYQEINISNDKTWELDLSSILWKNEITEKKLENILQKIISIKNNPIYLEIKEVETEKLDNLKNNPIYLEIKEVKTEKLDNLLKKYYEKIIQIIFHNEIENIDDFLKFILEYQISNFKYSELKWDNYINLLKEEKEKKYILENIKDNNYFYKNFYFYIYRKIYNLNLEETKNFLKNFDKKVEKIKENYEEYLILNVWKKYTDNIDIFEKKLKIYKTLENSKSYEVKKLSENIFNQISELKNPEFFIEKIEKIFLENRLPYTAKIFKIFLLLYNEKKILDWISDFSSPYLQKLKEKWNPKMLYATFFKDLLKNHIFSGNRDLKKFLQEIEQAKNIFQKEKINEKEKEFLYEITLVLWDLIENFNLKNIEKIENIWDLEKNINEILEKMDLKNISEVFEFFENNFLKQIWFKNTKDVLDFMEKNIYKKNEKSKNFENFEIESWDLVKWFDSNFYNLIWNEGFVSREFLWVDWDSDLTPFDLDLIKINDEKFENIFKSIAWNYGNTLAVIKNGKNEIFESNLENIKNYKNHGFELFKTWKIWENHFWIRTWLPSVYIDYFIIKSKNTEEIYNFLYSIAKSGIFIPVLDENKNIIFSWEDFKNFKKIFQWVKELSKENIFIDTKNEKPEFLSQTIKNYPKNEEFEKIKKLTEEIYLNIWEILKEIWIEKRENKEKLGYEIQSTGSTWRNTFLPNSDFDFDLNIKLDNESYEKVRKNLNKFLEVFENKNDLQKLENTDNNDESLSIQFLKWEKNILWEKIEVDLLFSRITSDNVLDTNKVLEEKLENIRNNSKENYLFTISNIRAAKKFFKENNIYKKLDWGLGWVWIEFWILNNDWNFEKAVKTFLENAIDENWEFINYSDFKKKYFIYSAWENIKWRWNDKIENFIFKIWENWYFKICEALKNIVKS